MKRKVFFAIAMLFVAAGVFARIKLYSRPELELKYDVGYYTPEVSRDGGKWYYEKVLAGLSYYLYIPEDYRNGTQNQDAGLPLVVTFNGSDNKGVNLPRYGEMFVSEKIQGIRECAVLVVLARGAYYSDCHDVSLLIQNILMKNPCIDKTNIIGFGHSQGAEFVVKLACHEPALFRGVISGSGYYQPTFREYLRVLPVQFYWKIAKRDKGIYEQGYKTGRRLARYCRNSINIEIDSQVHFWVELDDEVPGSDMTFLKWFESVVK